MLINLRNALMTGKRLPYDAEVEYLESTGNAAWIDTGIPNSANIKVVATAQCVAASGRPVIDLYLFGSGWGADPVGMTAYGILYSDYWTNLGRCMLLTRAGGGIFSPDIGFGMTGDGKYHVFEYIASNSESSISVDGGTPFAITTRRNLDGTTTYGIFGPRGQGTTSGTARLSELKVYDLNGNLLQHYIPVRVGQVGYLYDRVSGKLFGNAGTGAFTYGNDLKYPIPAS